MKFLADDILADCSQNRQSAKINSLPKFPAIQYIGRRLHLTYWCMLACRKAEVINYECNYNSLLPSPSLNGWCLLNYMTVCNWHYLCFYFSTVYLHWWQFQVFSHWSWWARETRMRLSPAVQETSIKELLWTLTLQLLTCFLYHQWNLVHIILYTATA